MTEEERAAERIAVECAGKVMILRDEIRMHTNRQPIAVILPRSLNPRPYDVEGQFLGLPVKWGETTALIYEA